MSTFSFYSSKDQKVTAASSWESLVQDPSIDLLPAESKTPGTVWWLDVQDASQEDVKAVAQALSIHPLTIEDVVMRESREKVEVFRNYYFISFHTVLSPKQNPDTERAKPAEFYILVFSNGTVTFSPSGCNHVQRVRDRVRRLHDPAILSSDWLCYAIIVLTNYSDDIVDGFAPYMHSAERESESIEDQVFIARADDVKSLIPRIDTLRKKITYLIRALSGKVDVLNGFVKRCQAKDKHPAFPDGEDLLLYLGDVQDHLVTTMSNLAHFDEIVGRSQSNCLAQLSATNLRLSYNITSVMSRVTVLATIFVPLHLVTGLFGMNVEVPGQEVDGLAWFFGIVGFFLAFTLVACLVAARFQLL